MPRVSSNDGDGAQCQKRRRERETKSVAMRATASRVIIAAAQEGNVA